MNRFNITKNHDGKYVIIDKLKTMLGKIYCNTKYTNLTFPSIEAAQGYLFGKRKIKQHF